MPSSARKKQCSPCARWGSGSSRPASACSWFDRPEVDLHLRLCLEAVVGEGRDIPQVAAADIEKHRGLVAAVLKVMGVGIVHSERDAVTGSQDLLAVVGHEHQLAGHDD